MNNLAKHYVYEWVRPDINIVFYVGKGSGNRAYDFNYNRNRHTKSVIKNLLKKEMKPCVRIVAKFVNEDSAYEFEEERIAFWGLENLTNDLPGGRNGGGGMKGKKHTQETLTKMSAAQQGRVVSLDARRKTSVSLTGRKASPETCAKMSSQRAGRKLTETTVIKISEGVRAAKNTPHGKLVSSLASLESQNRTEVRLKKSLAITAAKRKNPNHWTNKLTESEVWEVGTLLSSKEEISQKYKISVNSVTQIRKIIENKIGVGPRKNIVNKGKKHTPDAVRACAEAKKNYWNSKTEAERKELGRRMSEGRARAKESRALANQN